MVAAWLLAAVVLSGSAGTDELFVDRGACPGEGCFYGEEWVAREAVELRAAPGDSSQVVETLAPGERVETVTGEVHTLPGRFVVTKPRDAFEPGDELLLYTYLGEGWYQVRHEGRMRRADLGFSPWDRRCRSEDEGCWGVLKRNVRFWWWVKLRTPSGTEGWALDSRSFQKPGP